MSDFVALMVQLRRWYAKPLGQQFALALQQQSDLLLSETFGHHAFQLGDLSDSLDLLRKTGHYHRALLDGGSVNAQLLGDVQQLPLRTDSVDLLVLAHSLDFCHDPHQLLREVDRVLVDGGYLLVIGFNPWSLWGLLRYPLRWRESVPWSGHFYSMRRVGDWLSLLQFQTLHRRSILFRPPFSQPKLLRWLAPLETLRRLFPTLGGGYLLLARKQTVPMTLIRPRWRAEILMPAPLVGQTQRSSERE